MANYFVDADHVRYDLVATHDGKAYNWIFLPGGPGADSSYLYDLAKMLNLPGNTWLVDLPGNGSNTDSTPKDYNYDTWFNLLVPVVKKFENPIIVGHSFGGMFPLLYPELEEQLKGYVILNSAPSLWLEEAGKYAQENNLPDLSKEMGEFIQNPNPTTFKGALAACTPYYFPPSSLEQGRAALINLPFNYLPAVWWMRKSVELNFNAKWIPQKVPTLILSGQYDGMAPMHLFPRDPRFQRSNIKIINIKNGGHMPWVENPEAVKDAFKNFRISLEKP